MTATRPQRFERRAPRRRRNQATRLRVEQLEDRVVPSLTAGSDVPGELLIRFQPGVSRADVAGFYAEHGLAELQNFDFGRDLGLKLVATPTPLARELLPA